MKTDKNFHDFLLTVLSVVLIILVWYAISLAVGSSIIMPSPVQCLTAIPSVVSDSSFFSDVGSTIFRALVSFILIFISGTVIGMCAGRYRILETLLNPVVVLFKAVPVMSVILVAFIWFTGNSVPVFSAFLMAFPVMYVQTKEAMHRLDRNLNQMCCVYGISGFRKLKYFTVPSILPSVITGAKQTLSMIWKVVIATEVLTVPKSGIGKQLQLSQIQLQTARVFAWTAFAILLTWGGDSVFDVILKAIIKNRQDLFMGESS